MKIRTKFGEELEVDESKDIFYFPEGILGFEEYKKYVIIEPEENAIFKWLQSIDDPSLAFIITNPLVFWPDYRINITKEQVASIKLEEPKDFALIVICTVPGGDISEMTANLMGPIVINMKNRHARQLVLDDPKYTTKHRVFPNKDGGKAEGEK